MCRGTPLFNFAMDMLAVELDMLTTDQDSNCGGFRQWRLVLIMVVQNNLDKCDEQGKNRDGCTGSLF